MFLIYTKEALRVLRAGGWLAVYGRIETLQPIELDLWRAQLPELSADGGNGYDERNPSAPAGCAANREAGPITRIP